MFINLDPSLSLLFLRARKGKIDNLGLRLCVLQVVVAIIYEIVKGHCLFCLQAAQCDAQESGELIEQALRRWDADKIGIPDYALESSGYCRVHV